MQLPLRGAHGAQLRPHHPIRVSVLPSLISDRLFSRDKWDELSIQSPTQLSTTYLCSKIANSILRRANHSASGQQQSLATTTTHPQTPCLRGMA